MRAHQFLRAGQSVPLHARDKAFGRAGGNCGPSKNFGRLADAANRGGMRAEHYGISRFERNNCFIDGGRGRIRARNNCAHNSDRDSNFENFFLGVFVDDADGFHVADCARDFHRGDRVLDYFVRDIAVAGFFNGGTRNAFGCGDSGFRDRFDNRVHLFLGET